jgi:hypothetical protein
MRAPFFHCGNVSHKSTFHIRNFNNGNIDTRQSNYGTREKIDGERRWLCPEGYHEAFEDETGQCYSNEEGYRDDGFVLVERDDEDKNDICGSPYTIYDEKEVRNEVFCIKQCEENPDRNACSKDEQKNHDNSLNVKTNIVSTVTECSDRGFEHGEEGEWGY